MHAICVLILLFTTLPALAQLDSLKGKVRFVRESGTADEYRIPYYLRESSARRRYLDEETIFWEFKRGMFPRMPERIEKEFDREGRLIKSTRYRGTSHSSAQFFTFDTSGNLVQRRYELHDSANIHRGTWNYEYNTYEDTTDLISAEIYSESGRFEMVKYYYDEAHRLVEKRDMVPGSEDMLRRYSYDRSGKLVREDLFRIGKKLVRDSVANSTFFIDTLDTPYRIEYVYNADGTLSQESEGCMPGEDARCRKIAYTYISGKLSKVIHLRKDTVQSWREYAYNEDNLVKKITWYNKSDMGNKNYVEYFYEGKELVRAVLKENSRVSAFDFEYIVDGHNNWTEQKKYLNNQWLYTRKREITYW